MVWAFTITSGVPLCSLFYSLSLVQLLFLRACSFLIFGLKKFMAPLTSKSFLYRSLAEQLIDFGELVCSPAWIAIRSQIYPHQALSEFSDKWQLRAISRQRGFSSLSTLINQEDAVRGEGTKLSALISNRVQYYKANLCGYDAADVSML